MLIGYENRVNIRPWAYPWAIYGMDRLFLVGPRPGPSTTGPETEEKAEKKFRESISGRNQFTDVSRPEGLGGLLAPLVSGRSCTAQATQEYKYDRLSIDLGNIAEKRRPGSER